jgi:hypothetical protein
MKCVRKTAGYSLLGCERNELTIEKLKIRPQQTAYSNTEHISCSILIACHGPDCKTNAALHPQRKTVKRETSREMAGGRNRPLGLLLGTMMMVVMMIGLIG